MLFKSAVEKELIFQPSILKIHLGQHNNFFLA